MSARRVAISRVAVSAELPDALEPLHLRDRVPQRLPGGSLGTNQFSKALLQLRPDAGGLTRPDTEGGEVQRIGHGQACFARYLGVVRAERCFGVGPSTDDACQVGALFRDLVLCQTNEGGDAAHFPPTPAVAWVSWFREWAA